MIVEDEKKFFKVVLNPLCFIFKFLNRNQVNKLQAPDDREFTFFLKRGYTHRIPNCIVLDFSR